MGLFKGPAVSKTLGTLAVFVNRAGECSKPGTLLQEVPRQDHRLCWNQ